MAKTRHDSRFRLAGALRVEGDRVPPYHRAEDQDLKRGETIGGRCGRLPNRWLARGREKENEPGGGRRDCPPIVIDGLPSRGVSADIATNRRRNCGDHSPLLATACGLDVSFVVHGARAVISRLAGAVEDKRSPDWVLMRSPVRCRSNRRLVSFVITKASLRIWFFVASERTRSDFRRRESLFNIWAHRLPVATKRFAAGVEGRGSHT